MLSSLGTARTKSRDAKRLQDIRQFQTALELYYNDNGKYPESNWVSSYESTWNTGSLSVALKPYLSVLPIDPINTSGTRSTGLEIYNYSYFSTSYGSTSGNMQWYMLLFNTEKPHPLQNNDGSRACDGTFFNYNSITLGGSCVN